MLIQLVKEKQDFLIYKSEILNIAKTKYNLTKQKCQGVLKTLKRFKYWLYKLRFILKIDIKILVE